MTPDGLGLELPRLAAHDCDLQGILTWLELWLSGFSRQQKPCRACYRTPGPLQEFGFGRSEMWGPGFAFQPSLQVMPLVCGPHSE